MSKDKTIIGNTVVVFAIVLYVLYFIFKPHYIHKYYYSKDEKNVVTAIHYYQFLKANKETLYFTYGYYDGEKPPEKYIKLSRTHEYILHWKNDVLFVYTFDIIRSSNGTMNVRNDLNYFNGKIKVKRPTIEEWNKMRESKSEEYIYRYAG